MMSRYKDLIEKIDQLQASIYSKITDLEEKVDRHDILINTLKNDLMNLREEIISIRREMKLNTLFLRYVIPLLQAILIMLGLANR